MLWTWLLRSPITFFSKPIRDWKLCAFAPTGIPVRRHDFIIIDPQLPRYEQTYRDAESNHWSAVGSAPSIAPCRNDDIQKKQETAWDMQ